MTFKAAKCPNCGGALQVPNDRTTVKCMYCGVDIVVQEAIQLATGRVKGFTEVTPIRTKQSKGGGIASIGCGGLLVLFAIVSFSQPYDTTFGGMILVGGLVIAVLGISKLSNSIETITALNGVCPYCATPINVPPNLPGTDCPACKKRIVVRGMKFISVDTPVGLLRK
jgi:DNA-directed RNA polymerase subunit RPC12/RpoP